MNYSVELQNAITKHGIMPENLLYMTIGREPLSRIISKEKTIEFRGITEHWAKKLTSEKDGVYTDKPITHLLLQGGYSKNSPRVLVQLKDWGFVDEESVSESTEKIRIEARKEGIEDDAEYFALMLGDIVYNE